MAIRNNNINSRKIYIGTDTEVVPNDGDALISGNVGIGTTSTVAKLDVRKDTPYGLYGPSNPQLSLVNTNTEGTAGFLMLSAYYNNTNNTYYKAGGIGGGKETATGNQEWGGYLSFFTTSDGTAGAASGMFEHMRITADGNVGIGTTDLNTKLRIQENVTSNPPLAIQNASVNGYSGAWIYNSSNTVVGHFGWANGTTTTLSDKMYFGTIAAKDVIFTTSDTEKMRITSAGNVGIGTDIPDYKLDVAGVTKTLGFMNTNDHIESMVYCSFPHGVADQNVDIRFGNISFWGYIEIEVTGTYSNQSTPGKLTKLYAVGTNPSIIYNNESRVSDALGDIKHNVALGEFRYDGTPGSETFAVKLSHIVSSGNGYTIKVRVFTHSSGAAGILNNLSVSPRYTEAKLSKNYVHYNDNVGIGTADPSTKLHVDVVGASDVVRFTRDAGVNGGLNIDFSGANTNFASEQGGYTFTTSSVSSAAVITSDGNVGIGTTSPNVPLEIKGADITTSSNTTAVSLLRLTRDITDPSFPSRKDSAVDFMVSRQQAVANNLPYTRLDIRLSGTTDSSTPTLDVMSLLYNGNVGIGTTSPDNKLSIGSTQNGGIDFLYDSSNSYKNQIKNYWNSSVDTRMDFNIGRTANVAPTTVMSVGYNSNVGIGTTAPDTKLQVNGTITSFLSSGSPSFGNGINILTSPGTYTSGDGGILQFQNEDVITGGIRAIRDGGSWGGGLLFYTHNSTAGNTFDSTFLERLRISSAGNVGIGTTNPSYKLDVSESVIVGSASTATSSANIENLLVVKGKNNYSNGITWYGDYGQILLSATNNMTGSARQFLITNALNNNKFAIIRSTDWSTRPVTNSTSSGVDSGYADFVIDNTGRVGIGTTSPDEKLSVNGNIFLQGNDDYIAFNTSASSGHPKIKMNSDADFSFLNTAGNNIFHIENGGNVGIGTTSPGAKFHVVGTGLFTDNTSINAEGKYFQTAGSFIWGGSVTLGVRMGTDNVTGLIDFRRWLGSGTLHHVAAVRQVIGGSNRYGLGFLANDISTNSLATTVRMYIDPNSGYVGIGTDSPDYPLHVVRNIANFDVGLFVGNQRAYGLGDFSGGALYLGKEESGGNQVMGAVIGRPESQDNSTIGTLIFQTRTAGTPTNKMQISSAGNVSIGNTNNTYKLDVTGTGRFTSTLRASNFIIDSDKTLKDNISDINTDHIDVKWKNFELKSEPGVKRAGVVAQELEENHPEFVRTDKDGIKSVAYIDLLIAKIAELEARLEKLEK